MPVFDWTRTSLEMHLPDGSTTLAFDTQAIRELDVSQGIQLPGWDASYRPEQLKVLLRDYEALDEADLWANLDYFLRAIIPVAKEAGLKMAIHPDDPPRPIFGLPRIVKNRADLQRVLAIVDDSANGLTLCSGSLGADQQNDIPALVREFGARGRIHFAHLRNVRTNAAGDFHVRGGVRGDLRIRVLSVARDTQSDLDSGGVRLRYRVKPGVRVRRAIDVVCGTVRYAGALYGCIAAVSDRRHHHVRADAIDRHLSVRHVWPDAAHFDLYRGDGVAEPGVRVFPRRDLQAGSVRGAGR